MLDDAKGQITETNLLFPGVCGDVPGERIDYQSGYSFIAFRLDGRRAVGKRFFDVGNDGSFIFELRARRIFLWWQFLPESRISEEIICGGSMNHSHSKRG